MHRGLALLVFFFLITPLVTGAQGPLVPEVCQADDAPIACGTCELIQLLQNVWQYLIILATIIATMVVIYIGFRLVVSQGNQSTRQEVKGFLINILIGLGLLIGAYAVISTIIAAIVPKDSPIGDWRDVVCIYAVDPTERMLDLTKVASTPGRITATGLNRTGEPLTSSEAAAQLASVANYAEAVCAEAREQGLPEDQCDDLVALMSVESGGRPGAVSSMGAVGLMQVLPSTAQGIDPYATEAKLKDPAYNISIGVAYYKELYETYYQQYGQNSVYASYNAGPKGMYESNDCEGMRRWECPINPGGYVETQNYVKKINSIVNSGS